MPGLTPSPSEATPVRAERTPEQIREQIRAGRKREVRAKTVGVRSIGLRFLTAEAERYPEQPGVDYHRPATRGDCEGGERPCPFVSCKYNLYLDVGDNGSIKLNFPDLEVWDLPESCVLDIAARDGLTLEEVGTILNVTRERIRQIEARVHHALLEQAKRPATPFARLAADHGLGQGAKRRLPVISATDDLDEVDEPNDEIEDQDADETDE